MTFNGPEKFDDGQIDNANKTERLQAAATGKNDMEEANEAEVHLKHCKTKNPTAVRLAMAPRATICNTNCFFRGIFLLSI